MRVPVVFTMLCLSAGALALPLAAAAQPADQAPPGAGTPPPGGAMMAPGAPGAPGTPGKLRGKARFDAANTTHDGRLTLQQAQAANWRIVAMHFQEIDKDNKGYVTMQDLREWARARRAARAARGMAPGAMAPGAPPAAGAPPAGAPPAGAPPSGQQY